MPLGLIQHPVPASEVSAAAFGLKLTDPACRFIVGRRWFGYDVRRDQWACRGQMRNCHTLYLIHDGQVAMAVNGRAVTLGPGSVVWLSPNVAFDMTWPPVLAFSEMWFSLHRGRQVFRLKRDMLVKHDAMRIRPIMELAETLVTTGGANTDHLLRHATAMILRELLAQGPRISADTRQLSPTQQARLARHVREQILTRPTPAELADVIGLSPDYFARIFRHTFGVSPRDYLIRERMKLAARLLVENTRMTVYQVSDHLGYANVAQFTRQFRQIIGQPPHTYRRRH